MNLNEGNDSRNGKQGPVLEPSSHSINCLVRLIAAERRLKFLDRATGGMMPTLTGTENAEGGAGVVGEDCQSGLSKCEASTGHPQ